MELCKWLIYIEQAAFLLNEDELFEIGTAAISRFSPHHREFYSRVSVARTESGTEDCSRGSLRAEVPPSARVERAIFIQTGRVASRCGSTRKHARQTGRRIKFVFARKQETDVLSKLNTRYRSSRSETSLSSSYRLAAGRHEARSTLENRTNPRINFTVLSGTLTAAILNKEFFRVAKKNSENSEQTKFLTSGNWGISDSSEFAKNILSRFP